MVREIDGSANLSHDNPVPRSVFAGCIAVLLHLTFLIFSISRSDIPVGIDNAKFVTLLPLDTAVPGEKLVLMWMDLMDPMGTVKPDRKNGFSVSLPEETPQDEKIVIKRHYLQLEKGPFMPLNPPAESSKQEITRFWEFKSAGISKPAFSEKPRQAAEFPVWQLEDGTSVPQLFEDLSKISDLLSRQEGPLNETVLQFERTGQGLFPRVKLDVSCGNAELDKLAVKALIIKGKDLFDDNSKIFHSGFIAVKWVE